MGIWIAVGVVVLLLLYVVSTYNRLVKSKNKVKANWAQIDVVLKRRADLIPNLVETVKGYAKHESETLESVIAARNKYVSANTQADQIEASGELTQALSRIMMLTESYPELKADKNFGQLQDELKETENKIQYSRQFYNDSVYSYDNLCETFPSSLIAGIFNFNKFEYFKVDETDKAVPKVEF